MAAFAIRSGTSADHAFVSDLGARTVGDSVAAFRTHPGSQPEESYFRLLEFVFDRSHVLLIAHDKSELLGFALMLDTMTDEVTLVPQGFVAYMAVEPKRRRSGVAKALLEAVEHEARERGLPYMALMVTESNSSARALYESAGYLTERRLLCKTL